MRIKLKYSKPPKTACTSPLHICPLHGTLINSAERTVPIGFCGVAPHRSFATGQPTIPLDRTRTCVPSGCCYALPGYPCYSQGISISSYRYKRKYVAGGTKGSPAAQGGNLRRYQQKLFPSTSYHRWSMTYYDMLILANASPCNRQVCLQE